VVAALFVGHAGFEYANGQGPIAERVSARRDGPRLLQLADGTEATALSANTHLEPVEVSPTAVTVRLESGSAHFDVAPRKERRFRVEARDVTVTVLGTAFTVQLAGEGVRVQVDRGRVDVAFQGTHRELVAGEELLASPSNRPAPEPKPVPVPAPASSESPASNDATSASLLAGDGERLPPPTANAAPPAAHPAAPAAQTWRALAQDGDYRGAFARMTAEGPGAVRDEPGDLLFAADVARLSGNPALAIPRLSRVLQAHANDSRAPLAAFTLGRTLLDGLGRPREAADAFARARRLAPSGALAQDALAREVESWSRAGESALARQRALEYLKLYPGGRREKAVRYHGGLE
jgi:transmembrane sensor